MKLGESGNEVRGVGVRLGESGSEVGKCGNEVGGVWE